MAADTAQVPRSTGRAQAPPALLLLAFASPQVRPRGPARGTHRRHHRAEASQSALLLRAHRPADRSGLRGRDRQGRRSARARETPRDGRLRHHRTVQDLRLQAHAHMLCARIHLQVSVHSLSPSPIETANQEHRGSNEQGTIDWGRLVDAGASPARNPASRRSSAILRSVAGCSKSPETASGDECACLPVRLPADRPSNVTRPTFYQRSVPARQCPGARLSPGRGRGRTSSSSGVTTSAGRTSAITTAV